MIRMFFDQQNAAHSCIAVLLLGLLALPTTEAMGQTEFNVTVDVGSPGDTFSGDTIDIPELVGVPYNGQQITVNVAFANGVSLVHSGLDGMGVGIRLGTDLTSTGLGGQSFSNIGFITDINGNEARSADFINGNIISSNGRFASYGLSFDFQNEPTEFFGLTMTFDLPAFDVQNFPASNTTSASLRLIGADDYSGFFTVTAVPEPSSLALLGLGGLLAARRRRS